MPDEGTGRPVAVVTGTTGGIGGALAPILVKSGWDLALINRSAAHTEDIAASLRRTEPQADIGVFEADLADHGAIKTAADAIAERYNAVHALFNVAGYLGSDLKFSPQGHDLHFELNTLGPLLLTDHLCQALAKGAVERGRCVVVNTSSNAIGMSGPLNVDRLTHNPKQGIFGAYGQTKLALTAATNALAGDYAKDNIHLYAVDPGSNRSAMTKGQSAPFFVRWMSSLLPGPETGAAKLMAPLNAEARFAPGALIVGGKPKPQPKQAGEAANVAALMTLLRDKAGLDLSTQAGR
ncbi:MAG: SDR family NAD(P)-dependent oxidoreductase [Pseudomonadota bacterium]